MEATFASLDSRGAARTVGMIWLIIAGQQSLHISYYQLLQVSQLSLQNPVSILDMAVLSTILTVAHIAAKPRPANSDAPNIGELEKHEAQK